MRVRPGTAEPNPIVSRIFSTLFVVLTSMFVFPFLIFLFSPAFSEGGRACAFSVNRSLLRFERGARCFFGASCCEVQV